MRTLLVGTARRQISDAVVEVDAETIVIDTDNDGLIRLELDDGKIVDLDRTELEAALRAAA